MSRLFFSLPIDPSVLEQWRHFQSTAPAWPIRWMSDESLHITIKFLGEIDEAREKLLSKALRELSLGSSLSLSLQSGEIFPLKGTPSIFWTGLQGDIDRLKQLVVEVEKQCELLGFAKEPRDFYPHITVGRLQADTSGNLRWLRTAYKEWVVKFSSGSFTVKQLFLMKSQLSASGARYEPRAAFSLR